MYTAESIIKSYSNDLARKFHAFVIILNLHLSR